MTAQEPIPPTTPLSPKQAPYLKAVDRVLYPLTFGYTLVLIGMEIYEFLRGGGFTPRFPVADVYLTLLGAYAAQREGAKWLGADEPSARLRRGELFVGAWFALYLAMLTLANLYSKWTMPVELKTITLGVLGIFAAGGISASVREKRRGNALSAGPDRREDILRLLRERGGLSSEAAAQALGVSQATAWRLLETLEKEGKVRQTDAARRMDRVYHLT
jgi:hypothetical protein